MLVVIGANGRTGLEILRLALASGRQVRPVCRDDRDTRVLEGIVSVQDICYADPDDPESLGAVMEGARQVVIAIDPRVAGPGAPMYGDHAGATCIEAATRAGAEVALYLSVAGGYRWSARRLNRRAFHLDRWVRQSTGRWSMMRFSCFHDEVIEGHVRPPDGGRPHTLPASSRWAPLSRADAARAVLGSLDDLVSGRTIYVGGPRVYSDQQLAAVIAPHVVPGSGAKTRFFVLPPGDLAVLPSATRVALGFSATETLEAALSPGEAGPSSEPAPAAAPPPPMAQRPPPGPHPADAGRDYKITADWGPDLRRVIHSALVEDLGRLGLPTDGVTVDLRYARAADDRRAVAHDGTLQALTGVRVLDSEGAVLHKGAVEFLHDALAQELRLWWVRDDGQIPEPVWRSLDLGVQRRARIDRHFADDARVQAPG
ncbi:MAG: NAD(P)H-binding protein [Alphaproteobacteria bacterium]|nr:NAD(P)H-binding protein [Alphaproteobacteria bacterium]